MPDTMRELVGAIHIHSSYSDGTKTIPEIARLANDVGLDYIMVTDHMTLEPYHQGLEGFYGNTAVLIGYEINDPDDKNHYLAFGLDRILPQQLKAADYVKLVKARGGFGIIAHPDEIREELAKYPSYPWTDWSVEGYDGIEIWNHMSQWMESLSRWNMVKQAFMPRRALHSPTDRILRRWDEVNQQKKIVGVGSIDVHAYPYRLGPLRITVFPYKVQFKAIRTHIMIPKSIAGDFGMLKQAIYQSLRDCRVFISNYRWGDARGFQMYAENSQGRALIGGELAWEEGTVLITRLPKLAELRLINDSNVVFTGNGQEFNIKIKDRGLFRAEIYIRDKGWIFTNHVRLY
jgi:hypothetical protein